MSRNLNAKPTVNSGAKRGDTDAISYSSICEVAIEVKQTNKEFYILRTRILQKLERQARKYQRDPFLTIILPEKTFYVFPVFLFPGNKELHQYELPFKFTYDLDGFIEIMEPKTNTSCWVGGSCELRIIQEIIK